MTSYWITIPASREPLTDERWRVATTSDGVLTIANREGGILLMLAPGQWTSCSWAVPAPGASSRRK